MPANKNAREKLIGSARELLWDRGYSATSPRAILDHAGAGQGSMYHHFAGKEQLATVALELTADELIAQASVVLGDTGSAHDRLTAYLLRQRDVLRGCPVGRMAGDPDVLNSSLMLGVLSATFERVRALVTDVIEQGARAGEFSGEVVPRELADTVLAVVQGGYVLARAAGDPAPFDRAVSGAVALLEQSRREPPDSPPLGNRRQGVTRSLTVPAKP